MQKRMRVIGRMLVFLGVLIVFVVFFNTTVNTPERFFFDGSMSKEDLGVLTLLVSSFLFLQGFAFLWIGTAKDQS